MEEDLRARLNGHLERYVKILGTLPEPNEGRIEELKAAIRNGTLVTPQAIEGAANRLYEMFAKGKLPN